jgi:hypothetical protein
MSPLVADAAAQQLKCSIVSKQERFASDCLRCQCQQCQLSLMVRQRQRNEIERLQNELALTRTTNEMYKETVERLRNELVIVRAKLENEICKSRPEVSQVGLADDELQNHEPMYDDQQGAVDSGHTGIAQAIKSKLMAFSVGLTKHIPAMRAKSSPERDQSNSEENDEQCAIWDVLNNVPGVVGFVCNSKDLQIKRATKKACGMWGSSRLLEQPFHSLLKSANCSGSRSLEEAIDKIDQWNDSRVVRLGCVGMTTQAGRYDFAFTAVAFPKKECESHSYVVIIGEKLHSDRSLSRRSFKKNSRFSPSLSKIEDQ